jgi:hypothetical protein
MPILDMPDDRVREHTAPRVLETLDRETAERVRRLAADGPDAMRERLRALEREWDVERLLELNASALAFTGLALGATRRRRWLLLPGVVLPFLAQHAVQGWCPPLAVLRRLGVRTRREIGAEKTAIKALLGDFRGLALDGARAPSAAAAERALAAASA